MKLTMKRNLYPTLYTRHSFRVTVLDAFNSPFFPPFSTGPQTTGAWRHAYARDFLLVFPRDVALVALSTTPLRPRARRYLSHDVSRDNNQGLTRKEEKKKKRKENDNTRRFV